MKENRTNQKGIIELAVIVIIVAGIAVAGYFVLKPSFKNSGAALPSRMPTRTPTSAATVTPSAFPGNDVTSQIPAINNKADLSNRLKELDNTNVDEVTQKLFEVESEANQL